MLLGSWKHKKSQLSPTAGFELFLKIKNKKMKKNGLLNFVFKQILTILHHYFTINYLQYFLKLFNLQVLSIFFVKTHC